MGTARRRAGWYPYDLLDNGSVPSARELLPGHQALAVGDLIPATPRDPGVFGSMVLKFGKF